MKLDRLLAPLTGTAVALILCSLVVAAFTLTPTRAAPASVVLAQSERAAPAPRGMERVRDIAPADALVELDSAPQAAAVAPPEPTAEPTPVPTPVPTARPAPVAVRTAAPVPVITTSTAAAESRMLALMNASRAAGGLVALTLDAAVSAAARLHSEVESRYGYVYHDGPDGTAKARDVAACGSGWYGENTGKVWRGNVDALHVEFMAEPWEPINHRTNIMDPAFRRVGIGAVQGSDALYMTMVFCR
ncbi:MAG TPA: CAP domain-containing protein [Candidatus Limnocylindria bacterium]|jgi:uncharacterized protein YkwD